MSSAADRQPPTRDRVSDPERAFGRSRKRSPRIRQGMTGPMQAYDVVIIGAGHNGLTCAAYLGMAGLAVKVVERRAVVGGAAVTEEFCPGFRNSVAAYTVSLLNPKIITDLRL